MSGPDAPFDRLIDETRARREQLHAFVQRLRVDRHEWTARAESLPRRARLTAAQRQLFRAHLTRHKRHARG